MNSNLARIAKTFNIKPEDIKTMESISKRKKLFIYASEIGIISITTLLGYVLGKANPSCYNCDGYPFGLALLNPSTNKKSYLITALLSILGFLIAYKTAQDMFSYGIKYNVYKKR